MRTSEEIRNNGDKVVKGEVVLGSVGNSFSVKHTHALSRLLSACDQIELSVFYITIHYSACRLEGLKL
jgi:hypothetical protein